MPTYHVQAAIEVESGLSADTIVNTWTVDGDGLGLTPEDDAEAIATRLTSFYSALSVEDILGSWATGDVTYFVYNIVPSSTVLGSPIGVISQTMSGAPSENSLPLEVAIVLSFAGPALIGVPAQRRKGRVFIGPIATTALDFGSGLGPRPSTATLESISDAFATLGTGLGTDELPLQIWSRVEGEVYPAVRWWVDNEVDTMRSRGLRATTRVSGP